MGLGFTWNTANNAILAEDRRVLIDDLRGFNRMKAIGVGEHVRRHISHGDASVTVIIGLTAIHDRADSSRPAVS